MSPYYTAPIKIEYAPLPPVWPGKKRPPHSPRPRNPFKVVTWSQAERLLLRELGNVGAKDVRIHVDVRSPFFFRQDGGLRADAKMTTPAVILSFTRKDGVRLQFPCDTYGDWTVNIYAIAKSLELLRAIDRYGVTQGDAQYVGFRALPPAGGSTPTEMTVDEAASVISAWTSFGLELVRDHRSVFDAAVKQARAKAHPDAGGDGSADNFDRVQRAAKVLEAHFNRG